MTLSFNVFGIEIATVKLDISGHDGPQFNIDNAVSHTVRDKAVKGMSRLWVRSMVK